MDVKMTTEQWIEFCKKLMPGDIIHESEKNLIGGAISWGTEDSKGIDPNHSFQYIGDGVGKCIEACPDGTKYTQIDSFRNRVLKGTVRLWVDRINDLTVGELDLMKNKWKELVGKKYGWWTIAGFAIYGIFNRFTPFGGLFRMFMRNPFANKNTPVCSQDVYLAVTEIERVKPFMKEMPFENATPNDLANWDLKFSKRILDTYRIGRYNHYDYPVFNA